MAGEQGWQPPRMMLAKATELPQESGQAESPEESGKTDLWTVMTAPKETKCLDTGPSPQRKTI